jgi:hypothetical protein
MSVKVIGEATGLNDFIKKIQNSKKNLNVGFLNPNNAIVAAKNEYGGVYPTEQEYKDRASKKGITLPDEISIPPRPFMQTTFVNNENKWGKLFTNAALENNWNIENSLNILGSQIRLDIRDTIENGSFEKNSPRTIAIKGSEHPLIDTGEMSKSVDWELK